MSNRRFSLAAIACEAIGFIASSGPALAQSDDPSKPVKIIVPFPAGAGLSGKNHGQAQA